MKFEVDTDTLLEKVTAKMFSNIESNARSQDMSEEEVAATLVLNKKKVANDARQIAIFFESIYIEVPAAEEPAVETAE